MMRLTEAPRSKAENIVPMINVAFLLLIFFLMAAVIAPPNPVSIDPPKGEGSPVVSGEVALFIEADGTLWKDGRAGAALGALTGANVELRSAHDLPGSVLAGVLQQVRDAGASSVNLVVARP